MVSFYSLIVAATATSAVLAGVIPRSVPLGTVTCGTNKYTPAEIGKAIVAGLLDLNTDNLQDNYPHEYYDEASEDISLYCLGDDGPWYEFPLVPGGAIYVSPSNDYHSPGTDRVVFGASGDYCATVTHTGAASYDGFVACSNDV